MAYQIRPDLAAKIANRHWTPNLATVREKGDKKWWDEQVVIEDVEFTSEKTTDGLHERLRIQFKVPFDTESENTGRVASTFLDFYWDCLEKGEPKNRTTQTTISYQTFAGLTQALGFTENISPGDLKKEDVQGMRVTTKVELSSYKGEPQMRLGSFRAPKA